VENGIAEAAKFFHLNALSSPILTKVQKVKSMICTASLFPGKGSLRRVPGAALLIFWAVLSMVAVPPSCPAQESGIAGRVEKPVAESIRIRQATQKSEETWRDEKQKEVARLEALEREAQQLEARKKELTEKTAATETRIHEKEKQLADIGQIQADIMPLMEAQVEQLRQYLAEDLPFLPQERRQRIERLEKLQSDPEIAVSEKFRKVMEALQVEAEYGNTIEVYQQTICVSGRDLLSNIFRLGRMALFYQSLDQKACGFFDVAASAWKPLPSAFNPNLQAAIEIGAKQRPVEMLVLPLGRIHAP
jgi:Protein of unknown function (DUF3450)